MAVLVCPIRISTVQSEILIELTGNQCLLKFCTIYFRKLYEVFPLCFLPRSQEGRVTCDEITSTIPGIQGLSIRVLYRSHIDYVVRICTCL